MKIDVNLAYDDHTIQKGDLVHQPSLWVRAENDKSIYCKQTFRITAERIKALRLENGLSQTLLAKVIKATQKEYWRLECQDYKPNIIRLVELAYFYNVSLDYIMGISDEKTPISEGNVFSVNGFCINDLKK